MPNYCFYKLKAVAKDANTLNRLIDIMNYHDPEYFIYRCFEAEPGDIETYKDYSSVIIEGDVAWGMSRWFRDEEDTTQELGDGYPGCEHAHYTSLKDLCNKLDIGIQAFGREDGMGFEEFYLVNHKGEVTIDYSVKLEYVSYDDQGHELSDPVAKGGYAWDFSDDETIYGDFHEKTETSDRQC